MTRSVGERPVGSTSLEEEEEEEEEDSLGFDLGNLMTGMPYSAAYLAPPHDGLLVTTTDT